MPNDKKKTPKKGQPTPKAPQNPPKMTAEQTEKMVIISEKGQAIMGVLDGLTYSEAGMVLQTCDRMLKNQVQNMLNTVTVGKDPVLKLANESK